MFWFFTFLVYLAIKNDRFTVSPNYQHKHVSIEIEIHGNLNIKKKLQ